ADPRPRPGERYPDAAADAARAGPRPYRVFLLDLPLIEKSPPCPVILQNKRQNRTSFFQYSLHYCERLTDNRNQPQGRARNRMPPAIGGRRCGNQGGTFRVTTKRPLVRTIGRHPPAARRLSETGKDRKMKIAKETWVILFIGLADLITTIVF